MGADAVLHQHGEVLGREGRRQLQQRVLWTTAQERAVVVDWGQSGGEEDSSLAPGQRLPEQEGRVQAEESNADGAARLGDSDEAFVVEFGSAPKGVQAEIEFQEAPAEIRRL